MGMIQTQTGIANLNELPRHAMTASALADTLAKINRFAGRTPTPWPVAAHSVIVSRMCDRREDRGWALLHDAHEAFIGDIITPAAHYINDSCASGTDDVINGVEWAKKKLDFQIRSAWSVDPRFDLKTINHFDEVVLQAEMLVFFGVSPTHKTYIDDIERAVAMIREYEHASHWQIFKSLWADEVLTLSPLGVFTPPALETN